MKYEYTFTAALDFEAQISVWATVCGVVSFVVIEHRLLLPVVPLEQTGFNTTIFAYGQTGSGKTFSMQGVEGGNGEKAGIIPRMNEELFARWVPGLDHFRGCCKGRAQSDSVDVVDIDSLRLVLGSTDTLSRYGAGCCG